jgi:phosphate-selective porin OprO/OprP
VVSRLIRGIIVVAFVTFAGASGAGAQPGTPAVPAAAGKDPEPVEWSRKDGETTFRFGAGKVTLSNRFQLLWTDERHDGREARRSFDVPRARTTTAGWLLSEHLTYELQLDWAEGPVLEDLLLSWDVSRTEAFKIQVGQFKVPLGRQRLTSSGSQQFVDRSVVSREFTEGRDIGVQVNGLLAGRTIEYRAGVFNGAGQNTLADDGGLQYDGRVVYQPLGEVKYSESDLEHTEKPVLAIAGNVEVDHRGGAAAGEVRKQVIAGTDAAFNYRGLSFRGELYLRRRELDSGTMGSTGFLVQAGYLLVPRRLEIAGRYATWEPGDAVPVDGQREVGLAVGYFVNGHNLKLQSDLRRLREPPRAAAGHELRVQLQLAF